MKTVEILEEFVADGQRFHRDDRPNVTREQAARFCAAGWARDHDGEFLTGAPDTSPKTLQIRDGVQ